MTSRDFCYWLQGFFEISQEKTMTEQQMAMVKKHLGLVFAHEIDPSMGDANHQKVLDQIHKTETTSTKPTDMPLIRC